MSEIGLVNINNLLNQVSIIKKKYDDLAEYTGENYNVFNVLGIYNDELSHSKIIGDFLNVKGSHGQKDTFLKLFLNEINGFEKNTEQLNVLDNFKSANSCAHLEKNLGKVDNENGEGGRIDILINDGKSNIIIENKIGAGDQNQQLLRYNKFDTNAPILYLTLEGNEPSIYSISDKNNENRLSLGKDFVCISYRINIVNWLENCIIEMENKPIIKESLNQYLVLVKQLTNQSSNIKMKDEIINLVFQNEKNLISFIEIQKLNNEFYKYIIENKLIPDLKEIANELNLELLLNKDSLVLQKGWPGFRFTNYKLKSIDISITVSAFQSTRFSNIHFGITSDNKNFNFENIIKNFNKEFQNNNPSNHWKCKVSYENYQDFNNLSVLQKIYNGDFKIDLKEKVSEILNVIYNSI